MMKGMNMNNVQLVKKIAKRMADVSLVENIIRQEEKQGVFVEKGNAHISRSMLSHGYLGLCLLFNELDLNFPEEGWSVYCNNYLKIVFNEIQNEVISTASLFSGYAGICLVLDLCSNGGKYLGKARQNIFYYLKMVFNKELEAILKKEEVDIFDYDAIEGVAGIVNLLLMLNQNEYNSKEEIIRGIQYLVSLAGHKKSSCGNVPKWHISKEHLFTEGEKKVFPNGILNLGVSHGIAGPLIALSKAYNKGIQVPGQMDAIQLISNDLIKMKLPGKYGWNGEVGIEEYVNGCNNTKFIRDAWCYGTPGIAYALLLSSFTLESEVIREQSYNAMMNRIGKNQEIFSPTFCHGYSGLAYIYYKFYLLLKEEKFLHESERLLENIISFYDEGLPFGFPNVERDRGKKKLFNTVGLLDGVTGTLLTILELSLKTKKTAWDTAFLLN
ncbi:MAG: lanthionine synthetase C family protein [Ruminococcus sp.]|nr:lanthionine synthetase C family protein [Ruminococcus sp.]